VAAGDYFATVTERPHLASEPFRLPAEIFGFGFERADATLVATLARLLTLRPRFRFRVLPDFFGFGRERADTALVAALARLFSIRTRSVRGEFLHTRSTVPTVVALMIFVHYYSSLPYGRSRLR
jgi:hypothetical protein